MLSSVICEYIQPGTDLSPSPFVVPNINRYLAALVAEQPSTRIKLGQGNLFAILKWLMIIRVNRKLLSPKKYFSLLPW